MQENDDIILARTLRNLEIQCAESNPNPATHRFAFRGRKTFGESAGAPKPRPYAWLHSSVPRAAHGSEFEVLCFGDFEGISGFKPTLQNSHSVHDLGVQVQCLGVAGMILICWMLSAVLPTGTVWKVAGLAFLPYCTRLPKLSLTASEVSISKTACELDRTSIVLQAVLCVTWPPRRGSAAGGPCHRHTPT